LLASTGANEAEIESSVTHDPKMKVSVILESDLMIKLTPNLLIVLLS
jgi:hypothetical protein